MKKTPTPYSPLSGSSKLLIDFLKNSSGICIRIPEPSPAFGSAPTAPLCSKLHNMDKAFSIILCERLFFISTMNPTPQESCSFIESYRP